VKICPQKKHCCRGTYWHHGGPNQSPWKLLQPNYISGFHTLADFGVRSGSSYTWLLWLLQAVWIFFKTKYDNIAKDYQKIPWQDLCDHMQQVDYSCHSN